MVLAVTLGLVAYGGALGVVAEAFSPLLALPRLLRRILLRAIDRVDYWRPVLPLTEAASGLVEAVYAAMRDMRERFRTRRYGVLPGSLWLDMLIVLFARRAVGMAASRRLGCPIRLLPPFRRCSASQ
jgi:hypothetical protein